MRPTIVPYTKNPAGRPGSLLITPKTFEVKKLQKQDKHSDDTDARVQAILAPLVSTIDQFCSIQHASNMRREPEEFGCTDSEFLRDAIKFCGGQELAVCDVRGADGHHFQVAGSSYGLKKVLQNKRSDGVGTGLPVEWICPVTGRAFLISSLRHLLDVIASYAHRDARKATSV